MQLGRKMSDPSYVSLNITAVFSPPADVSADVRQIQEDLPQEQEDNKHDPEEKKKALKKIIADYNDRFGTNHRIEEFDGYYQDVQTRIKDQQYPNEDFRKIDPEGRHQHKIDLTIVAAILTIIGYSLNDTIVIFDRIREVRGKSSNITAGLINDCVNQTLSRTILTSLTVFMVVVILYIWGGPGIHGFAFALVVGTISGTYSTIYVASPVLLWLHERSKAKAIAASAAARA